MSEQPHLTIEEKLMAQMYRRYKPRCPAYDRFRRSLVPSIANAVAEFQNENEWMNLDKAAFRNITSFDISALLDGAKEWARSDD